VTIASVTPSNGLTSGGTPVSILGSNFGVNPIVQFNGVRATSVVVVNPTTIVRR
jgi:large repetitive protein